MGVGSPVSGGGSDRDHGPVSGGVGGVTPVSGGVGDSSPVSGGVRGGTVLDGRGRREWFRLTLGVGSLGVVGALVGQWPRGSGATPAVSLPSLSTTPLPAGLEARVPGLSPFVTPASTFYRIDTALSPPSVDISSWRLSVEGMVDHPFSISWDELLAMDAIERPVTLECVSNEVGQDLIGSALWQGVRTSELLTRAGVQAGADMVLSTSIDNFSVSTPLGALTDDRDALVAYGMNGASLPQKHGFPVRLLTPGLYGFVGATKWLVKMEVTTFAAKQAYWTKLGWSDHEPIKPSSRIEVPRPGAHAKSGTVTVGGTAWAHGVGVGKVQVRVDRGSWADATLARSRLGLIRGRVSVPGFADLSLLDVIEIKGIGKHFNGKTLVTGWRQRPFWRRSSAGS